MRIFLVRLRTQVKNRIHATLARHNIQFGMTDLFGVGGRAQLASRLVELPEYSRATVQQELGVLDSLEMQIESAEQRLETIMAVSVEADLLQTLPCIGKILSMVLMLEPHCRIFNRPVLIVSNSAGHIRANSGAEITVARRMCRKRAIRHVSPAPQSAC